MTNIDITFAIPFYRNVDLLRVAVESVLAQEHKDWRLLVCDDSGAELPVESMLEAFDDPRIRYIKNSENLGMVPTWNRCIDAASTDLVTLLHADDVLLPNYASVLCALAAANPNASAFYCAAKIIDRDGESAFSFTDSVKSFIAPRSSASEVVLHGEGAVASLMAGYFIMTPTLCYRKSKLEHRRFEAEFKQVQDLIFVTGLLMEGHTLVGTKACAYAYRRHDESATTLQSESMLRFDEEVIAFDRIADAARALQWNNAERVARRKRIIKLHLYYRALGEIVRGQFGRASGLVRYRMKLR
jgi:glycosyltransferase involved in cell wall biosynthesis